MRRRDSLQNELQHALIRTDNSDSTSSDKSELTASGSAQGTNIDSVNISNDKLDPAAGLNNSRQTPESDAASGPTPPVHDDIVPEPSPADNSADNLPDLPPSDESLMTPAGE